MIKETVQNEEEVDIFKQLEVQHKKRKNKMYTKPLGFLFGYISDKMKEKDSKTN